MQPQNQPQQTQQPPQPPQLQPKVPRAVERRRLSDVLSHTVHRLRFVIWGALIAVLVFLVAWFSWNEWNKRVAAESTRRAEQAQELYDQWLAATDATKKAELEKDLVASLDSLVARYSRHYGGQRGLLLRGDLRFEGKAWEPAAKDYEELARRFPDSYLAPIALFDAAVCREELGETAAAQRLFDEVASRWKDSAVTPRALFAAGRLAEGAGSWDEAKRRYEQLDTDWSFSAWSKLAKNRLIALKVSGKIQ